MHVAGVPSWRWLQRDGRTILAPRCFQPCSLSRLVPTQQWAWVHSRFSQQGLRVYNKDNSYRMHLWLLDIVHGVRPPCTVDWHAGIQRDFPDEGNRTFQGHHAPASVAIAVRNLHQTSSPNIFQQTECLHAGEITTLMQSSFLEVLGVLFFVWFVCRCSAR